MNECVAQAIAILQHRCSYYEPRDFYLTEVCEKALTALGKRPALVGNPADLADEAFRNAAKTVRRRKTFTTKPATRDIEPPEPMHAADPAPEINDRPEWFDRLRPRDRQLVGMDALGFTAGDLAAQAGVTKLSVYVQLSRARVRARDAYLAAAA